MTAPIMIPAIDARGGLYPVEKLEAHSNALFHLAVSVFVFDGDELLIQQRAASKYHCGGQWANTCCSHPHWGESASECAERRLAEELGIQVELLRTGEVEYSADVGNGLHEHERVTLFEGRASRGELGIDPNPDEVMSWRWISPDALRSEIKRNPAGFTPWFRIYVERYPELIFRQ